MTDEQLRLRETAAHIATTRFAADSSREWTDYAQEAYEFISGDSGAENSQSKATPTAVEFNVESVFHQIRDHVRTKVRNPSQRDLFLSTLYKMERYIK